MFLFYYNTFLIDRYPRSNAKLTVHNDIVAYHHGRNEDLPVFLIDNLHPLNLIRMRDNCLIVPTDRQIVQTALLNRMDLQTYLLWQAI